MLARAFYVLFSMGTLQRVLRTMMETRGNLSEAEAARLLFTSRRSFRRVFPQVFGTSFRKKRLEIKLDRAQELLDTTDWPIPMIAENLGYSERSKLDKPFAESRGMTPAQYRARRRSNM